MLVHEKFAKRRLQASIPLCISVSHAIHFEGESERGKEREREGEEAHTVSRGNGRRRGSLAGRTDFSTLFLQNRISDLNCEPSFVPPFIDSLPQTRAQRLESRESALRVSRVHSRTLRPSDSRGCVLDASGGKERV